MNDILENFYVLVGEKLQKVFVCFGVGFWCDVEVWIVEGWVNVNGSVVSFGQWVDSYDVIIVDGYLICCEEVVESVCCVLIYNKLEGEVCICDDLEGCLIIFDCLLCLCIGCWINVGCLDINIIGLLLFIIDGELVNCLMYFFYEMDCEYVVWVCGEVIEEMIECLFNGVMFEDGLVKFSDIQQVLGGEGFNYWYYCVVMEGCNCEVCWLWEFQGLVVSCFKWVCFGLVFLIFELIMGCYCEMDQCEIDIFSEEVGFKLVVLLGMIIKVCEKVECQQCKQVCLLVCSECLEVGCKCVLWCEDGENVVCCVLVLCFVCGLQLSVECKGCEQGILVVEWFCESNCKLCLSKLCDECLVSVLGDKLVVCKLQVKWWLKLVGDGMCLGFCC